MVHACPFLVHARAGVHTVVPVLPGSTLAVRRTKIRH